jgi:hypothetical protein
MRKLSRFKFLTTLTSVLLAGAVSVQAALVWSNNSQVQVASYSSWAHIKTSNIFTVGSGAGRTIKVIAWRSGGSALSDIRVRIIGKSGPYYNQVIDYRNQGITGSQTQYTISLGTGPLYSTDQYAVDLYGYSSQSYPSPTRINNTKFEVYNP